MSQDTETLPVGQAAMGEDACLTDIASLAAQQQALAKVHSTSLQPATHVMHQRLVAVLRPGFLPSTAHLCIAAAAIVTVSQQVSPIQVAGSDWKLSAKGQSAEATQEPKFSTWDDVLHKKQGQSSSAHRDQSARQSSTGPPSSGRVVDDALYR